MSTWQSPTQEKVTLPTLQAAKHHRKLSAVTAYDVASARLADAAGLDLILVGDSLAMTMLGHDNTLAVTMDEMLLLTRAVRRGLTRALLVADMPYGSYHSSPEDAVRNALRFVQEAGAEAVKLEGGRTRTELIRRLTEAEIPTIGHLGLTPQSVHRMGGFRVQARSADAIERLREDAHLLADAGCIALVLEGVPREVAGLLTAELAIPTIGIGAGPDCDGQILVWHDLLGLAPRRPHRQIRPPLRRSRHPHPDRPGAVPPGGRSRHLPQRPRKLPPQPRGPRPGLRHPLTWPSYRHGFSP